MAQSANENARQQSQFAKNGMALSTGDIQAQGANTAAAAAQAQNTNAQLGLQNYQAERGAQQGAPTMMQQASSAPLSYLNQVSPALMAPASAQGNILSALSGGGQVTNLGSSQAINPSMGSDILNGFSGVVGSL
jgi:hypothetical protein